MSQNAISTKQKETEREKSLTLVRQTPKKLTDEDIEDLILDWFQRDNGSCMS